MSKKITSFLTMLVALFMSINASAQVSDYDFENKAVTLGGAVESIEPNTWYFMANVSRSNEMGRFLELGEVPTGGGIIFDNGAGSDVSKRPPTEIAGEAATTRLAYMVRFIDASEEGESDVYLIQFATGNFIASNLKTESTNKYDAAKFNIYNISEDDPGKFGWNQYNMGSLVNNNGVWYSLVYWKSGQITSTNYDELVAADTHNSVWSIHPVIFTDLDPEDVAWTEANKIVDPIREAYDNTLKGNTGTLPGQYSQEAVDELGRQIGLYDELAFNDYEVQDIYDAAEAVRAAYEAVLASKIPILSSGYYRIKTRLTYAVAEEVPTEDEGDPAEEGEEQVKQYTYTIKDKYLYSNPNGDVIEARWGSIDDEKYAATAIWQVTQVTPDNYEIINAGTEAGFLDIAISAAAKMKTGGGNIITLTTVGVADNDNNMFVAMRSSTPTSSYPDYQYMHQGGHGYNPDRTDGKEPYYAYGTGGNIVGWTVDADASQWLFVPVSQEEVDAAIAAYDIIKNHDKLLEEYDELVADAQEKLEIAKDIKKIALITENSQFSSPYTDPTEGNINNMIDNNGGTYWHSTWQGGNVEMDTHYLQVEINDADLQDVSEIYAVITRRNVYGDHVTEMNVRGTNDADAEKDACELLATITLPFGAMGESGVKSNTFNATGYKYLRFYPTATTYYNAPSYNNRGYFHFAEFQLYHETANPNAQINFMGDLADNLETVIDRQATIARDQLDISHYNRLKEAYDAFMAKFVDPTELRNKLAETESLYNVIDEIVKVGSDPGFWSEGSDASSFGVLWREASAYDAAGDYTPAQSADYVERLSTGSEDIFASANGVDESKWYYFRFPSEDEFKSDANENGWEKQNGAGDATDSDEALYGKYAIVADANAIEGGGYAIEKLYADQVSLGSEIYFMDEVEAIDNDMAKFRFINVGDTAYIIQNKATGLFIKAGASGDGAVKLSVHPSLFNTRALGYGLNQISTRNLTGGDKSDLHAQRAYNVLVSWNVASEGVPYIGSRSALYIEDADDDVSADYDGTEFNLFLKPGKIYTYSFPVEIATEEGLLMWGLEKVETVDEATIEVTLCPIEKAVAGRPFIVINGETDFFDAQEDDAELFVFTHGYDLVTAPQTSGILKGSFEAKTVGAGVIIAQDNELVVSKRSATAIGANEAYISEGEAYDLEAEVFLVLDENGEDGIAEALTKVAKSGAAYTLDGRLVSKNANLNSLKGFGKGIYILNGVKVIVK